MSGFHLISVLLIAKIALNADPYSATKYRVFLAIGMNFSLEATSDNYYPGKFFEISDKKRSVSVGRSSGNLLKIDHTSVSSRHAEIEVGSDNEINLIDRDSSNGTFVNGTRIDQCPIKPGDLIRFASAEFRVVSGHAVASNQNGTFGGDSGIIEINLAVVQKELSDLKRASAKQGKLVDELQKALDEAALRESRINGKVKEARNEVLELEGKAATLQYELTQKDKSITQWEGKCAQAIAEGEEHKGQIQSLEADLKGKAEEVGRAEVSVAEAQATLKTFVEKLKAFTNRLQSDWKDWFSSEGAEAEGKEESEGSGLRRADEIRQEIREQLDLIEPIWHEHGNGVQKELKSRCKKLEGERDGLSKDLSRKEKEQTKLEGDLAGLREKVDSEIRRAQGLSRKGTEVEIPERLEPMVIARDLEQQVYLDLIDQVEFLDQLLEGYRRSRKLRKVVEDLDEFRKRCSSTLKSHSVEPFAVDLGLMLTLKHRAEVKVFVKKGWGTREHEEKLFQPGEVTQIVRTGYRVGKGDGAVILRKVEVLIREVEG